MIETELERPLSAAEVPAVSPAIGKIGRGEPLRFLAIGDSTQRACAGALRQRRRAGTGGFCERSLTIDYERDA